MSKTVSKINEQTMAVKFYSQDKTEFFSILDAVKALPGRKWNAKQKSWECPITEHNLKELASLQFDIDVALFDYFKPKTKKKLKIDFPETLNNNMYPYQKEGAIAIHENNGRTLLGDEMGLGKTIQAISFLATKKDSLPAVVVCPASLKINWQREIKKWTGMRSQILNGKQEQEITEDIVIVNYDIIEAHVSFFFDFNTLIIDECHYVKNNKAIRTKAVKKLQKNIKYFIPISGTPITSRPIEFFNVLSWLRPDIFNSYWHYAERYCGMTHNGFGYDFKGATNSKELHEILIREGVMIRRLKADVLIDLPPKTRTVIPILNNRLKEYQNYESQVMDDIESGKIAALIAKFELLKQKAVDIKMKESISWIEDFLQSDEKLVVFATHHETIDTIYKHFKAIAVKLDGRDSKEQRQKSIDEFQNNTDIKIFIGNIKAAGVGITLTAASNVAFLELGWTPGEHDQAEDRCHRIGQDDSVTAWYLIASGTIEEDIAELLDEKRKVLTAVLDGQDAEESSLIKELIKKYKIEEVA